MRRSVFSLNPAVIASIGLAAALVGEAPVSAEGNGDLPKASGAFLDLRRQQPVSGNAEAGKALSQVCSACHGERGIGIAPTFPNLAGQSPTYLYLQLKSFKGGQRSDPVMAPLAAPLADADMRNLAAYFASLPARTVESAAPASTGGKIFSDGDPTRGIPPCQACHGPGGRGVHVETDGAVLSPQPPWFTIPRLQGQSGVYVAKALHDFKSGTRGNTSNAAIMRGVAEALSEEDIQSLASFLEAQ